MKTIDKNAVHVRRYLEKDIDLIVENIMEEVPKLPHYKNVAIDRARIKFLLHNAVNDEVSFMVRLLVNDDDEPVGGVAAYCVTGLLSWDKVCSDLFLFVKPEWRSLNNVVKLIDSYKTWAKQREAKIIGATHTGGIRSDAMDMLLIKNGFERVGAVYYLKTV